MAAHRSANAKLFATKADFATLRTVLDVFREDCGRYPTTVEGLSALLTNPKNLPAKKWNGPYLKDLPMDSWGHELVYINPGRHNTNTYDLYSLGKDGISKSGGSDLDDINNWDPNSPHGGYEYSDPNGPRELLILLSFACLLLYMLTGIVKMSETDPQELVKYLIKIGAFACLIISVLTLLTFARTESLHAHDDLLSNLIFILYAAFALIPFVLLFLIGKNVRKKTTLVIITIIEIFIVGIVVNIFLGVRLAG